MNAYPADLPRGLADIADIVGLDIALLLSENFGGVPQYVPMEPNSNHKLAKVIGLPALKRLSSVYAGVWIEIPRYAASKTKKVAIKKQLKQGTSLRETAKLTQTTLRYVSLVSTQMQEENRQLSLFDQ